MRDVTALCLNYHYFLVIDKVHIHENVSNEISPRINRYLKCDKWSVVTSNFTQKIICSNYFYWCFYIRCE